MKFFKWLNLQLFAGEGAGDGGGEGAATGESAVDPGRQRLLELGVPADKIRKNRAYKVNAPAPKPAAEVQAKPQKQKPEQAAAANSPTEEPKTDAPARLSWEEIVADPEYNKQIQSVVQSRLKGAKSAEEAMSKLAPVLKQMAQEHGLDPENIDYDALVKAIGYERKAVEMGVSTDTAKELDTKEQQTAQQQRTLEQQKIQMHFQKLEQQAETMKKVFPNFDLRTELKNPTFARMTSPNVGISVEDAYHAIHRKEIQAAAMQVTAQKTAQMISNSIQSGANRPQENGTSGQAPSVTTFDYSKASPEQRAALKAHIRSEAARGRKVYPGSYPGR